MCFFAPTKISDPIGSSFRSNAFDKTLTSRCSAGEKNDEVEGGETRRKKNELSLMVFRNANFYPEDVGAKSAEARAHERIQYVRFDNSPRDSS